MPEYERSLEIAGLVTYVVDQRGHTSNCFVLQYELWMSISWHDDNNSNVQFIWHHCRDISSSERLGAKSVNGVLGPYMTKGCVQEQLPPSASRCRCHLYENFENLYSNVCILAHFDCKKTFTPIRHNVLICACLPHTAPYLGATPTLRQMISLHHWLLAD